MKRTDLRGYNEKGKAGLHFYHAHCRRCCGRSCCIADAEKVMDKMPLHIRNYTDADAWKVGILIADTYREFNLSFLSEDDLPAFLGPFRHAHSEQPAHREAIANILRSPMIYVAEAGGQIAGVLRGREERLASLFVGKHFHRQGIATRLVQHFEEESRKMGVRVIRVAATVYAVPFYARLGYKRSTGLRNSWSFEGHGLPVQPMRKRLAEPLAGTG